PVSSDSATSSEATRSSLPSAGTMSPASIETTSPGTSCAAGISASWPSRPHPGGHDQPPLEHGDRALSPALLLQAENRVSQCQQNQQKAGSQLPEGEEAE